MIGAVPSRAARLGLAVALAGCGGARPAPAPRVSPVPLTRAPVDGPDPGALDDGVQVISGKGHVEPAAVEAGIASHREALASCYAQRVGGRRWLGGRLSLRWEVAADGSVARVLLADSDLGAWPIERCVLEAARAARFGKPVGGAAEVTLPLEFSLCRSPSATPSASRPVPTSRGGTRDRFGDLPEGCSTRGAPAAAAPPAIWDDAQSARAVGGQLARLDACARGKIAAPDDVRITVYVGPHGRAESVGFASAQAELDDAWAACAEKAALAWRLPDPGAPRGQVTKLAVRYRPR